MVWMGLLVGCGSVSEARSVRLGGAAPLTRQTWSAWPAADVALAPTPVVVPAALHGRIVAIDAGHGAPGNRGARSARCVDEEAWTLPLAERISAQLEAAGLRVVRLRSPGERPSYGQRLRRLADGGAELMVSVHGDIRGRGRPWRTAEGCDSQILRGGWGTSVLWSDEHPARTAQRRRLAHHLAHRLDAAGFTSYDGADYVGLYAQTAPGAFVDRHAPRQRIAFLRRPAVPSVIVEVGHLLDPDVEDRLGAPRVQAALAQAVLGGVVDTLQGLPAPPAAE